MRLVTFRHTAPLGLLAVLLTFAGDARAQSTDLASYVLFATDELRSRGLRVQRGDVGVNGGSLFVRMGVELVAPNSELSADTATIPTEAICKRLLARNPGSLAPGCPAVTTFSPPFADTQAVAVACGFPDPFPACSTDAAQSIVVEAGETRTLDPGTYGQIVVRSAGSLHGSLIFRPGIYTMCSLRTGRASEVTFLGPTTLRVTGDVRFGTQSMVNPGGVVDGNTIEIFARGNIVRITSGAQATLRICAPFSTLRIGRGAKAFGRFVGARIVNAGLETSLATTTSTSTSSSTTSSTSTSSTTSTSTSSSSTTSTSSTSSTSTTTSSTSSTSSSSTSSSTTSTSSTSTTTLPPRCGDGSVNQASEECDDGDTIDDDCCSNACLAAPDGGPCGTGDVCSGDQTCQSGVCTPTSVAEATECLVPFTSAVITNFDDATATLLDPRTGAVDGTVEVGHGAWGAAVHPAGEEMWVTARDDDHIAILDAVDGSVRETLRVGSLPLGIVFDPTGARAYVASFGTDRVIVLDVASRGEIASIPVGNGPSGLALDATGRRLYVSNFGSNNVSVVDLVAEREAKRIKTKKRPLELALDATRARLYVTNFKSDRVSVIGTISDSVLATIRVGKGPFGVAVDPARNRAYVTNAEDDNVSVLDVERCEQAALIGVGDGPLGVGLDLTATRALVANSRDDSVSIIDTTSDTASPPVNVGLTPVAFGGFIGPRLNDCPRAPLVCDDANPMTLDACTAAAGCSFEPYEPAEAAAVGVDVLDTTVREAGVEPLGGTTRAALLSRLVISAKDALIEGAGTPKGFKRADHPVKRFTNVVRKGIRRRKMSCGVAQEILDLSRGIHVQLRLARR